ncbi:FAD-dependent oxidoreductase [Rugosimonospora acidiphila]|uniref:FAD-dependent oxidoreductase n=2 Tax=Rugosimonospora acidiphila TaxID=556531 RepID=A0ABP9SNS7_9ACTN
MCVARALADHVERVTVVDRDRFPDGPEVRGGVPQAHHLHVLVTAGQRALDRLFPGILDELHKAGAVPVEVPTDVLYLTATGWRQRFPATHRLIGASRELIDWTVYQRLSTDERIRFLPAHEVVGLLPAAPRAADAARIDDSTPNDDSGGSGSGGSGSGGGGPAVGGVRLRPRGDAAGAETELVADLVVDASGRGSRAGEWLTTLGYPAPEETRIDSRLGYASRRYVLPDSAVGDWKNILIMPDPPRSGRGAVLYPIENDRWMLTLGGLGEDRPPTDAEEFLDYTRGLRSTIIYDVISQGRPDSAIHGYLRTSNHRRHFETMRSWPLGFLVVGDAACCFNPVYGQGMSVAAQTAVALDEHLRARPAGAPPLDHTAQVVAARCASVAWLIATGADSRLPTATTSTRPGLRDRLSHQYLSRASDVANRDPYVCEVLTDVMHLVAPPTVLTRPKVMARVLRGRPGPRLWTPPERPA